MLNIEWRRRVWHISPGFLPFLLWPVEHRDPVSPTLMAIIWIIAAVVAGSIFVRYRLIARGTGDTHRLQAVAGYAGSVLATIILLPAHPEIALAVLGILAFGDGFATLAGLLLGGPTLPWNRQKRWSGLVAFVLIGGLMSSILYWGEAQPRVSFETALICGFGMSFVAGLVESWPSRLNDNVRVGLAAACLGIGLHALLVGLDFSRSDHQVGTTASPGKSPLSRTGRMHEGRHADYTGTRCDGVLARACAARSRSPLLLRFHAHGT